MNRREIKEFVTVIETRTVNDSKKKESWLI